jgi:hypothetical protein
MLPDARHLRGRPRRLRSRIVLAGVVVLGIAALLRGYGPYYLNVSPGECAGHGVNICTNHTSYRTLEHVLVTVTNHSTAAIVVEQDGDTGGVILTSEWQSGGDIWLEGGLGIPCKNYCQPTCGTYCQDDWSPPPPHAVQIPPGGSLTGDYMSGSPSQSLRYRLVLVYAPTAELLHATEDVLNGTGSVRTYMQPELASLPAYAGVVVSAPFDLIDNGDRFPAKPLPA